jgi:hypothetical protein
MKLKVNELSAIKQDGAMVAEVEARQRQNSRKALTGLAPNSIDAYFFNQFPARVVSLLQEESCFAL